LLGCDELGVELSFGDEIANTYASRGFREGKPGRKLLHEVALGRTGIRDWIISFSRLENADATEWHAFSQSERL
jgi:hypothetical protein